MAFLFKLLGGKKERNNDKYTSADMLLRKKNQLKCLSYVSHESDTECTDHHSITSTKVSPCLSQTEGYCSLFVFCGTL